MVELHGTFSSCVTGNESLHLSGNVLDPSWSFLVRLCLITERMGLKILLTWWSRPWPK